MASRRNGPEHARRRAGSARVDSDYTDARLSLARLCAVAGRPEEAREWFVRERAVLDEQGARPLRAITDLVS